MWRSFAAIGRGSSEIWRRKKRKKKHHEHFIRPPVTPYGRPKKLHGWGYCTVQNCMISTVFDWSTRVTDRRTDGRTDRRTDGFAIAYSALSMLSRAKNRLVQDSTRYLYCSTIYGKLSIKFPIFRYHDNTGWSETNFAYTDKFADPKTPFGATARIGDVTFSTSRVIANFLQKKLNSQYHDNRRWSDTNFTCTVKFADPENHCLVQEWGVRLPYKPSLANIVSQAER